MTSASPLRGIRLVALDLDGTLLPTDKRLTDRAKRVVASLNGAGIEVAIATGRGWTHVESYARALGLPGHHVAHEGAFVAAPSEHQGGRPSVLHERSLPSALIRAIHAATDGLGIGWFCCADDHRTKATHGLESRIDQIRVWDPEVSLHAEWPAEPAHGYVLSVIGPPAKLAEARFRIHALGLDDVVHLTFPFWDGWDQIQIRRTDVGKDTGLQRILDERGLDASQLLAAGDWLNDLGMLRMAAVAVCPANAVPEVRAVAHHVLDGTSDDDAVVRFLDRALDTL